MFRWGACLVVHGEGRECAAQQEETGASYEEEEASRFAWGTGWTVVRASGWLTALAANGRNRGEGMPAILAKMIHSFSLT